MKINLDGLTEKVLVELNREIVERERMIRQLKAQVAMVEFRIGERVNFDTDDGNRIVGTVARWNVMTQRLEQKNRESARAALLRNLIQQQQRRGDRL